MTNLVDINAYTTVLADELNNVVAVNDLSMSGTLSVGNNIVVSTSLSAGEAIFSTLAVTETSNFTGSAVFLSPPVMSGAAIVRSTIPPNAIAAPLRTTLTLGDGHVEIDLHGDMLNEFVIDLTGPMHSLAFLNVALNASFSIFTTNHSGAPQVVHKQLSAAGATPCYNTLAGNTTFGSNSLWVIRGKCISTNVILLDFINYT